MEWIKKAAAPVEVTMPLLQKLESQGYTTVTFLASSVACDKCVAVDEKQWSIAEFLSNTEYDAPIYSNSAHIGCRCTIKASGPDLEDKYLNYAGFVE